MKKLFLTLAICFTTLLASAQFMAVSTIQEPAEDESWSMSSFTNNLGIGYQVNDKIIVGVTKNGDSYNMFGRYMMGSFYAVCEADSANDMSFGLGYSLKFWESLYIEPNYMMKDEDGEFKVGVAYKF